jgi:hypothetical protein
MLNEGPEGPEAKLIDLIVFLSCIQYSDYLQRKGDKGNEKLPLVLSCPSGPLDVYRERE